MEVEEFNNFINVGKFKQLKSNLVTHILTFMTHRENICIIIDLNKQFLKLITKIYRKDNSLGQCLKDMKNIIKSIEEFKFITNNHCINLEENLKKFKENYNPFTFNRSIYMISSLIFKEMQYIDIQKNNIGLDGIILLSLLIKKSSVLVHLNLSYNNIGDEGCKFLAISLAKNASLQILNLECNGIADHGLISLSETISNHKTLKTIKFALNSITFEGIKYLSTVLEKSSNTLHVIDFKYNNLVIRDDYQHDHLRKQKISF